MGEMEDTIKVVIRIRPLINNEEFKSISWKCYENFVERIGSDKKEIYAFDRVFDFSTKTEEIYKEYVSPIIESSMSGYNGTIFAYGQSASGKTHTVFGNNLEGGIVHFATSTIFETINSKTTTQYHIRMACLEIYNEKIRDLLANDLKELSIKDVKDKTVIDGILEEVIVNRESVEKLIQLAYARRVIGETAINQRSSRSHVIIRFIIESHDDSELGTSTYVSYLNIVDLAGSENSQRSNCQGDRFVEGSNINRSLSALLRVIKQLSEKSEHISFRDSKLTRLLKPSLGGNAKTLIICNISPVAQAESSQTFRFASLAKYIKNMPTKNCTSKDAILSKYLDLVKQLESQENQKSDELLARNEELLKEILRLNKCILTCQLDDNKRMDRLSRRKTWGGMKAENFSSMLRLETGLSFKNQQDSPICEECIQNEDEIISVTKDPEVTEKSLLEYSVIGFSTFEDENDDINTDVEDITLRITNLSHRENICAEERSVEKISMCDEGKKEEIDVGTDVCLNKNNSDAVENIEGETGVELENLKKSEEEEIVRFKKILEVGLVKYNDLKGKLKDAQSIIQEKELFIASLQDEFQNALQVEEEKYSTLKNEFESARSIIEEKESFILLMKDSFLELEAFKKALDENIAFQSEESEKVNLKYQKAVECLKAAEEQCDELKAERNRLEKYVKDLEEKIAIDKDEDIRLEKDYDEVEKQRDDLKGELEKVNAERLNLLIKLEDYRIEQLASTKEIKDLKKEVSTTRQKISSLQKELRRISCCANSNEPVAIVRESANASELCHPLDVSTPMGTPPGGNAITPIKSVKRRNCEQQ